MPLIEHRLRELETKFQYLTGHKHTGAQGDAPIISAFGGDSDSITEGSVNLFTTVTEKANWNSAYGAMHTQNTDTGTTSELFAVRTGGYALILDATDYLANYAINKTKTDAWDSAASASHAELTLGTTHDGLSIATGQVLSSNLSGYVLLAGRAGGQTIIGASDDNGDLVLKSGATATSNYIELGVSGGINHLNGANEFIHAVGTWPTNPGYKLVIGNGGPGLWNDTSAGFEGMYCEGNFNIWAGYVRADSFQIRSSVATNKKIILATPANADYTLTLPSTGGTADYLIKTDGAGVWSHVDPGTLSVSYADTAGTAGSAAFADDATHANSADTAGNWAGHPYPAGAVGVLYNDGADNLSWVSALTSALADGKIFVGNVSNVATAVTPSGDVTISNAGVTAIGATKITDAMINSGAVSILHPSGSIIMYGGAAAPTGWLLCDGASYLRADYAALYAIIGNAFGTADGTHFNVPDMKGAFPRGAGQSTIFTDNVTESIGRTASKTGGATSGVGSKQDDQFQGHFHSQDIRSPNTGGTGTNYIGWTGYDGTGTVTQGIGNPSTDGVNGTPRSASENRPKNIEVNFIIKT